MDPLEFSAGSVNLYDYVSGNPVNGFDPLGQSILGKLWNLPNSAIGLTWGLVGVPFGAKISLGHNAIQFENHPFMLDGAITLGNVVCYDKDLGPNEPLPEGPVGLHEEQHTYQGELSGPLYLPLNIIGGVSGLLTGGSWHAPANFMESGPQSKPPRPWP